MIRKSGGKIKRLFLCFRVRPNSTNFDRIKPTRVRCIVILLVFFAVCFSNTATAQKKTATVSGRVVDENEKPLANVSLVILGRRIGMVTSDSGTFRMQVPAEKAFARYSSFGHKLLLYTKDSSIYKIAMPFTRPLADTLRTKDSLHTFFDTKTYVEKNN